MVTVQPTTSVSSGEPLGRGRAMDAPPWSMGSRGRVHPSLGADGELGVGKGSKEKPADVAVRRKGLEDAVEGVSGPEEIDQSFEHYGHPSVREESVAQYSEVKVVLSPSSRRPLRSLTQPPFAPRHDEARTDGFSPRKGRQPDVKDQEANAIFARRALAMLERLGPTWPCPPPARDHPLRTQIAPEELALLVNAQITAQRRRLQAGSARDPHLARHPTLRVTFHEHHPQHPPRGVPAASKRGGSVSEQRLDQFPHGARPR